METSETYQNISEAQLWRYFAGQATNEEQDLMVSWIKSDDTNKKEFHRVKELFYGTQFGSMHNQFDGKAAFVEMLQATHKTSKTMLFRPWMAVAAMITVLLGIGFIYIKQNKTAITDATIVYNYATQNKCFTLPDQSSVQLNIHSHLQYQTSILEKRAVVLNGEAYFDIQHNAARPFEITTGTLKIRVLGTAFNVNAKNGDSIVVSVIRGKVQLQSMLDSNKKVIITKGQTACFVHHRFTKVMLSSKNVLAWKERELNFEATTIKDVVQNLSSYFDTTIVLDSKDKEQQLTVSLKEPKLDSVLQMMQVLYNLKITKTKQAIVLKDNKRD